jgi:hypothetical protein
VVVETHDTPTSSRAVVPGWGWGTTDQRVPFQDSIRVLFPPVWVK